MQRPGSLHWRWRGLSCLEFAGDGHSLIIDPCFRRFPPWRMLFGRLTPTPEAAVSAADHDAILVTHPHWDHLLDAPQLALRSTGGVFGSPQTVALLGVLGVPENKTHPLAAGESLSIDGFHLGVLPAQHERVPGFGVGEIGHHLKPPLRARDYRLDAYFSYLITLAGIQVLTDPGVSSAGAQSADILFIQAQRCEAYYREVLERVAPRLVVPIHWDSLFHAGARPKQDYLRPRFGWPPLSQVSLPRFAAMVARLRPGVGVIIPEIDVWYWL
jgi:L-ascorbate metabolism protein UlaG (beta-lactamase superfamily)